ncbi:imm11 family protein [Tenacibaculum discolor]|uniref:imm11 family protein n=1 Tax=Tenacibaculum TaxID=104267 RepID=UPI000F594A1E|nr:DUF1629 domain-containing protein [Tenacibaculum discolor]
MKYYKIDWDYDNLDVIGNYPQVTLKKGYNPSLPSGYWQVKPHEFPNFVPSLELELHKKAKPTDYLEQYVNFGMIVSTRLKSSLEKFDLPSHAFYPIKVYHKEELLEYYWFHYIVDDFWSWINKSESKAIIYDDKDEYSVVSEVDLSLTSDEIQKIKKSLSWHQHMQWEKIVLNSNYPKYDVLKISNIEYFGALISERLLNALQEAGMTGFRVRLFDKIICE